MRAFGILYLLWSLTFLLAFDSARRYLILAWRIFLSVVSFLLLTSRAEIRPEGFSVFFMALDFLALAALFTAQYQRPVLFIVIPIVQILWVNTHIFFFMGPVLIGLFLWQARLAEEGKECLAVLQRLLGVALLVNL